MPMGLTLPILSRIIFFILAPTPISSTVETHPDDAYITNTLAVENAVFLANRLNIPMLYISTAGIFDGAKPLYDDSDTPNPLGVYARSKFMGERFVIQNAQRYLICRAGWMMGAGPKKDKKFIQKLMKQIKRRAHRVPAMLSMTRTVRRLIRMISLLT